MCRLTMHNLISISLTAALIMTPVSLTACGAAVPTGAIDQIQSQAPEDAGGQAADSDGGSGTGDDTDSAASAEPVKGSRDNTPHVLVPQAGGETAYSDAKVTLDITHSSDGYFMIDYTGDNPKPKLQVTGPEGVTYTFDVHGGLETIPFTQGTGSYQVGVFENISDTKYAQVCAVTVEADISNEYSPYLYPNQYVNFNEDSDVVTLGEELAYTADDDLTVVSNVYNYLIDNVVYDTDLANNVKSGYLPDPDETIATGKGICFDYAAVMASMLRSQQIPTRLEIGYAGDAYHAWISTYIEDVGWVNGIVEFNGTDWELMDPTLAASQGDKFLKSFIGDGNNYSKVYQY